MSDTKDKDETAPQNLPIDMAAGEIQPVPQTEITNSEGKVDATDGSAPPIVTQQDGVLGSGSSVPMDTTDTEVSHNDAPEVNTIGSEAETDASPAVAVETKVDNKIGTEVETMIDDKKNGTESETMVEDNKIGTNTETKVEKENFGTDAENKAPAEAGGSTDNVQGSFLGQTDTQAKVSSAVESVAVKPIPDVTVAKDGAAAFETETLAKPDEPALDTVAIGSEMVDETVKADGLLVSEIKADLDQEMVPVVGDEHAVLFVGTAEVKNASGIVGEELKHQVTATGEKLGTDGCSMIMSTPVDNGKSLAKVSFLLDDDDDGSDSGTEEMQVAFMKELESFFRQRSMEFKPPKFYGEGLNLLKLWRAVMRLGGYDKVTSCKLWRQVGESFRPPKTCTTVSWTFRGFYEKALLDYERHKVSGGEVTLPIASQEPGIEQQGSGSGRARRDAAARAMQGWHSQRLLGNGEVSDPIIKDKTPGSLQKREKQLNKTGLLKRKKPSYVDSAVKVPRTQASKTQLDIAVVDLGPLADWVKINVQRTKDCFEVYALVPGLLREEVRVQSDPAGRLVISGEPEHPENPWGVTPFKKVISLPSRIDPHQTSAVVTLHGQLFIRVPFEQSE